MGVYHRTMNKYVSPKRLSKEIDIFLGYCIYYYIYIYIYDVLSNAPCGVEIHYLMSVSLLLLLLLLSSVIYLQIVGNKHVLLHILLFIVDVCIVDVCE